MVASIVQINFKNLQQEAIQRQHFQENPTLVKKVDLDIKERINSLAKGILLAFSIFYVSCRQLCVEAFIQAFKGNRLEALSSDQVKPILLKPISPEKETASSSTLDPLSSQETNSRATFSASLSPATKFEGSPVASSSTLDPLSSQETNSRATFSTSLSPATKFEGSPVASSSASQNTRANSTYKFTPRKHFLKK